MYTYRKTMLFLVAFATGATSVLSSIPYNFFGKPSARIAEVSEYLKKSLTTVEIDAAQVALFLEKMRTCYYEHLDKIESAMPYWEWAKHNPNAYAASQLPHKWFRGSATHAAVDRTYTMIRALRDVYSAEFGAIVRLLATRHEDNVDPELWLTEVQKVMASLLSCSIKDLTGTDVLIQKVSAHEQHVAAMVEKVQAPGYIERHWIPLAVTTVAVGAAAYYYYNNQFAVHGFVDTSKKSLINFWKEHFSKKFNDLKQELKETMQPTGHAEKVQINNVPANFEVSEKALKDLQKYSDEIPVIGWTFKNFTKSFFKWANAWNDNGRNLVEKANKTVDALNETIHIVDKRIRSNNLNLVLFATIPACGLGYGVYKGIGKVYSLFTKRDRRVLVLRLCQAEQVLIRTTHQRELSDAEYGRLLYLLTKEYDQVAKNVFSDERIAFLDDLTYLADTQSSIAQKQKTLDSMWRKYRSLAKTV